MGRFTMADCGSTRGGRQFGSAVMAGEPVQRVYAWRGRVRLGCCVRWPLHLGRWAGCVRESYQAQRAVPSAGVALPCR